MQEGSRSNKRGKRKARARNFSEKLSERKDLDRNPRRKPLETRAKRGSKGKDPFGELNWRTSCIRISKEVKEGASKDTWKGGTERKLEKNHRLLRQHFHDKNTVFIGSRCSMAHREVQEPQNWTK